jgi:peptidoglycan/xylan/chitin deacetylase (PgdA/CDA1 family)
MQQFRVGGRTLRSAMGLACLLAALVLHTAARPVHAEEALTTGSVKADAPQCDPSMSLAGRELPVNTTNGPQFGRLQFPQTLPLADKEVVLTFDDGPHPTRTAAILDVLDQYCVKAVFFVIGKMALEHPQVVRDVARRGHVIGTHTLSHTFKLLKMDAQQQAVEIDGGFAALSRVLGGPVAPIFRFPGFIQSPELISALSRRDISVWSVDVITADSWFSGARIAERLFAGLDARGHGIVLMHDIKKATAESLPGILRKLKEKGYTIPRVTVVPTFMPAEPLLAAVDGPRTQLPQSGPRQPQKSGGARVAARSPAQPARARPALPEYQEQLDQP